MKLKQFKPKKALYVYGSLVLLLVLTLGVTFATFTDTLDFGGAMFSVANSEVKLLDAIGGGIDPSNLVDSKPGPQFDNVAGGWFADYPVEIYSNATTDVNLWSWANYEDVAVNDPAELRQYIYVEILDWTDANGDGMPEQSEFGSSYGRKTILKWNTEGIDLGTLSPGEVRSLALRFSVDSLSNAKQGESLLYDFEFEALGL
ncbi:hypothetical protein GF360_02095 [candidate division WWE3 bacterium]|nr:hypothetical protein [candidate division WWE3 bacterium]